MGHFPVTLSTKGFHYQIAAYCFGRRTSDRTFGDYAQEMRLSQPWQTAWQTLWPAVSNMNEVDTAYWRVLS